MIVAGCTVGPLQENCWMVLDPSSHEAVLVDPGDEPEVIRALVLQHGARVMAIWLTHAHVDHVGAVPALAEHYDVPVALHPDDRPLYDRAPSIASGYGMQIDPLPEPTIHLAEGDALRVGALRFSVVHLPGHAPGHVAFVGEGAALAGDVLFAGSIGRTDLPLSDPKAMRRSLERVALWPSDTTVYPGHGPTTSVGRELSVNPFLSGLARPVGS